ncbi:MAG: alpha/beta hydrolase-fold protein [Polaribacter sp.]
MVKKKSLIVVFTFFCFAISAQKVITKEYESEALEETRNIKIYLPEGYDDEENEKKNYPLAIVLNGDYLFDLYVGNSILFAERDKAPKQIVVGISMKESFNDDISFDRNSGKLTPSANNFYTFLRDEVLFYMEGNYRTSPFISLVGDGYAGNLITYFLYEKTPFINSYICINPSFSDYIGLQLQSYNLERYKKEDNVFYFYSNNSDSFSTKKQAQIAAVQRKLLSLQAENFNIINDISNTASSVSAISEAIPRALTKIFQIYSAISKDEYNTKIKDLSPPDAIAYLENKYLEIEFLFGIDLPIRERDIFAIENLIIKKENGDYLKDFGTMILKLFPSSPLGNYYIGRFYEEGMQMKKALIEYKKGYGKMDPGDPNADKYYENVLRVGG